MSEAFLVVGPEASGNRLTASILLAGGASGKAAVTAPWNLFLPMASEAQKPVVIRSFPHGGVWPDLQSLYRELEGNGYRTVMTLVVVRNSLAVFGSQVGRHVETEAQAARNIDRAYDLIFESLRIPFQIVTYEALVDDPAYVSALLARLGLSPMRENRVVVDNEPRPIRNENRKHYGS